MDFTPFGPILIAQKLIEDDFGVLSRAWERNALGEAHPIFLRRFPPAMTNPAVIQAFEHSLRALDLPATCGQGHQLGLLPAPHWKVDHRKSRSLRRIQEQCREEQFPLELGLSLHLAYTLAHVCARFWRAGLSVGPLSLDSLRVDFEGGLFLPDLGWLPTLIRLADGDPALREALPDLPRGPVGGELGYEAHRFGTFLYELITFEPLPAGLSLQEAISQAQCWTPEGPTPLPDKIRQGLARLLGGEEPFETLEGALKDFETLVFEDEDAPSTFNLAHLMHTLFRQNLELQHQQLEREAAALQQNACWAPIQTAPQPHPVTVKPKQTPYGLIAAAGLIAVGIGAGALLFLRKQEPARPSLATNQETQPAPGAQQLHPPAPVPQVREAKPMPPPPVPHPSAEPAKAPAKKEPAVVAAPKAVAVAPARTRATDAQERPAQVQVKARMAWPQGAPKASVTMRVFIHEDGHPLRATAELGATHPANVIKAATEAALKSRYLPALRAGQPVRDWVEVQFQP